MSSATARPLTTRDVAVSVVIPTFNRRALLRGAIESVLTQTVEDVEVIVVDDGSTDSTVEMLARMENRVRWIQRPHCGLLGVLRNTGLAEASGRYVAFLDSDDAWRPHKLERQLDVLERQADVGLVCTNASLVDGDGDVLGTLYFDDAHGSSDISFGDLVRDNRVIVSSVLARRDLIRRVDGFAEEPVLRGVEDYDLWLRLAAHSSIAYLGEPLTLYREHGAGMRHSISRAAHWQSMLRVLERAEPLVQGNADLGRQVDERAAGWTVACAAAQWAEDDRRAALRTMLVGAARSPRAVARAGSRRLSRSVERRLGEMSRSRVGSHGVGAAKAAIAAARRPDARRAAARALEHCRPLRIHVGAGSHPLPGWINTDVHWRASHYLDAAGRWPVPDDSVELVYGDQVVEHLSLQQARAFFRTAHRVLEPGGTIRLATPDVERTARMYLERGNDAHAHLRRHRETGRYPDAEHLVDLLRLTFGDDHRDGYLWDFEALDQELRDAGFVEVERCANGHSVNPALRGLELRRGRTVDRTVLVVEATKR